MKAFPEGVAGGGTGLTATHLQEMLAVPTTDLENGFLAALMAFYSRPGKVKVPVDVAPGMAGAPLIPLRKRDDAVRPIAMGDNICRLVSSLFVSRLSPSSQAFLELHPSRRQDAQQRRSGGTWRAAPSGGLW